MLIKYTRNKTHKITSIRSVFRPNNSKQFRLVPIVWNAIRHRRKFQTTHPTVLTFDHLLILLSIRECSKYRYSHLLKLLQFSMERVVIPNCYRRRIFENIDIQHVWRWWNVSWNINAMPTSEVTSITKKMYRNTYVCVRIRVF